MAGPIDNNSKHHRRSIRLAGYDYTTEGGYFITVVTHERIFLFGHIANGVMRLNNYGRIVSEEWFRTKSLRPNIELFVEEFVVMPNHIHGIIWVNDESSMINPPTVGCIAIRPYDRHPIP
jgi:putative transposase